MIEEVKNVLAIIGALHIVVYVGAMIYYFRGNIMSTLSDIWFSTRLGYWVDYLLFLWKFKFLRIKAIESERLGLWWVKQRITAGTSKHPYRKKILALIEWMQAYDPIFNEFIIEKEYKAANPQF